MTNSFRKFLLQNSIAAILLGIVGTLLFIFKFQEFYHPAFLVVLVLSLLINLLVYWIYTRKPVPSSQTMSLLGKAFAIKFFYYLLFVLIFVKLEKSKELRIAFILVLFASYLIFTILEVSALTKFFKSKNNNS